MRGNRRFDAVFFDLGHTLVCPHPSFETLFAQVCAEQGLPLAAEELNALPSEIDRAFALVQATGSLFSCSLEDSRRFWLSLYHHVLGATGRSYPTHLPEALYARFTAHDSYRVYADVVPALQALRAEGVRIGAISNWEAWAEDLLVALDLAPLFDVILISGCLGMEKPDPRLFRLALERGGVSAAQAVHVGDHPEHDCAAARAVGITPVLLDRQERHPATEWVTMRDLEGFPAWVLGTT